MVTLQEKEQEKEKGKNKTSKAKTNTPSKIRAQHAPLGKLERQEPPPKENTKLKPEWNLKKKQKNKFPTEYSLAGPYVSNLHCPGTRFVLIPGTLPLLAANQTG